MVKYQKYEEYKNSGVDWLGEIPKDWKAIKVKYIADTVSTGGTPKDLSSFTLEPEVCWFTPGDFHDGQILRQANKYVTWKSVNTNDAKIYKENSVLVIGIGATLGKVAHCSIPFSCNQQINVITPNNNISSFFLMYSLLVQNEQMSLSSNASTIGIMNQEKTKDILLALPSLKEQKTVTNFLDHETAQIDTLIEKQQTLIQLLKEKRQAVISHAVTKGLNSDAPMKNSGVEWLGEVPEHWAVKKNKHLLEFVTSGSRGWAEYYSDEGKLFFRITNLTRDTIEPKLESIKNVNPPSGAEGERSKIELNDLLISITADLGSVCVANDSVTGGFVSQHVSLCRPNSSVKSARWLAYFILSDSAKEQFVGSGYGGTKIQLSLEDIRELNIAYPPEKEQENIASYIDNKLEKFENLMSQAEQAIQLMQERRTALISAAVTGKIDVRGWRAPK